VYEDLVQEGTIGLIKAIEGFDLSLGYCFSSYAMPSIRGEMLHYFRDKHNPFKLRDEVVTCLSLDRNIRSSDSDGSPTSFMDTIPDPDGKNIEEVMSLRLAIESLDEKYRRVVELYYFKMMERKVIAKVIGVSPMTVTRYLQQSVMYLRRALN
jgi:RNA polymerase sigma-B factor